MDPISWAKGSGCKLSKQQRRDALESIGMYTPLQKKRKSPPKQIKPSSIGTSAMTTKESGVTTGNTSSPLNRLKPVRKKRKTSVLKTVLQRKALKNKKTSDLKTALKGREIKNI